MVWRVRVLHTQKKKKLPRPLLFHIIWSFTKPFSVFWTKFNKCKKKKELIFNKALKHKIYKRKEMEIWVFPMESHRAKKI